MHHLSLALPMLLLGVAMGQSDDPSYRGCFSDPADNRVFEFVSSTSAMTAEVCSGLCPDSAFYGTQYSTECWCGDNVGYPDNGDGICDMACSGNSDETCGGSYALSVYSNDEAWNDSDYLGCWSDPHAAETRLFSIQMDSSEGMTNAVCEGLCADYPLYGTQFFSECWCDDGTADYEQNGPAICTFECAGSTDEVCGGYDAMSIRQHEVYEDPNYLGCFADLADNRIFEIVDAFVDTTTELCAGQCSGYQYYGTQYSNECWCGDNASYDENGEGVCDMPCSGDSSEMCGGSYSMSVYQTEDVLPTGYRGCYSDPADNRVFVQDESSDAMTAELCASQCTESAFYGTQYSTECWCGDINAPYSVNGEGVCDMTCSGNSEETCGGSYNMDVYAHDPSYLGCFSDPADGRMFVSESSTSSMTAEVCAELCTGSAYYGTQYSQECWCGEADADYAADGFGVCDMPCSGNSDEMCGGSYTMSVYQAS